ncbi:MAG: hypothetical protein IIA09_18855 [Proteobacteria bacterium]|nr:hypothetical protein [Pseudomonadota bacterium]
MEAKQTMDEYVELFDEIRNKVDSEEAAAAVLNQIGKEMRMRQMFARRDDARRVSLSNGDRSASEKQVKYLKRLGVTIPEGLTRKQASNLIDEAKLDLVVD